MTKFNVRYYRHGVLLLISVLLNLVSLSSWATGSSFEPNAVSKLFTPATKEQNLNIELFEFTDAVTQQKAINLATDLRCPQCQNQNLMESNSPIAKDLRLIVFKKINQGMSVEEVTQYMTDRFGEFVLYKPSFSVKNGLLWLWPLIVFVIFILIAKSIIQTKPHDNVT